MSKINLYISPIYFISVFIIVYFGGLNIFCNYIVALLLHEYMHYIVAKRLGYMLNNISFVTYGAKLQGNIIYKNKYHKLLVTLSGPISNILLSILIIAIWWINPNVYSYTLNFVEANLAIGVLNLLPTFPLDGGQAILGLFDSNRRNRVYFCMRIVGVLVSIFYVFLFIRSAFYTFNFSYLFVSIFMFVSAMIPYTEDVKNYVSSITSNRANVLEVKQYIVKDDTSYLMLSKYFSTVHYPIFKFVDLRYKVVGEKTQEQIIEEINTGKYFFK